MLSNTCTLIFGRGGSATGTENSASQQSIAKIKKGNREAYEKV